MIILFFCPFFTVSCHSISSEALEFTSDYDHYTITGLQAMTGKDKIADGKTDALPGMASEKTDSSPLVVLFLVFPLGILAALFFIADSKLSLIIVMLSSVCDFVFGLIFAFEVSRRCREQFAEISSHYQLHFNMGYFFTMIISVIIFMAVGYGLFKIHQNSKPDKTELLE